MKTMKMLQTVLIVLAAVILLWGILTGMGILPGGVLMLSVGGLQRMANTLLLFSIALGVSILVSKKMG
ncbi:hypothetical protein ACFL4L_07800 [bacterium]